DNEHRAHLDLSPDGQPGTVEEDADLEDAAARLGDGGEPGIPLPPTLLHPLRLRIGGSKQPADLSLRLEALDDGEAGEEVLHLGHKFLVLVAHGLLPHGELFAHAQGADDGDQAEYD